MTGALVKGAGDVAAYGDNIDKMSQKMGMSAEAYQEWDAIMQHSGTSIEALQSGMKTLANAVENGNKAFERLGITQEDIASMNNEELFSATITALQNVDNETERTYLAGQLLGRGATELGALLNTSAEDTEAMRQRVHELGGVMSDEAVKAAAAYQDSLQDMQTAFSGLSRGMISDFLPSITAVMDGLTEIFSGDSNKGLGLVSEGISGFVNGISEKLPEIVSVGSGIVLALSQAITDNLPTLLTAGADAIITIGTGLVGQLPAIVSAGLDVIVSLANGITDNLPEFIPTIVDVVLQIVDTLTDPDTLSALIEASLAIIIALATGIIDALPKLIEKVPQIVDNIVTVLVDNAPKMFVAAGELIGKLVYGIVTNIPNVVTAANSIKNKIDDTLSKLPAMAIEWGADLIGGFISGIQSGISGVTETVSSVAETVKDFIGFSEPKKGPLSNFHTFAPDMMELFAKGIRDNESIISDQFNRSFDFAMPAVSVQASGAGAAYGAGTSGAASGGFGGGSRREIVIDLTMELDGATLARKLFRYNQDEGYLRGGVLA